TADLWIYLDLDGRWHHGDGEDSTEERAVTVAASVVRKALDGHRNVGLVTNGHRAEVLHPDRGTKQFGKLMQYLAEVHAGGTRTLQETLVETLPRLRRGASCLLITPSLDRGWVRPASTPRETTTARQAGVRRLRFRGGWFALPIYLVVVSMYPLSLQHADWVDIDEHFWWIALAGVLVGTLLGNGRTRVRRSMLVGAAVGTLAIVIGTT